MTVSASRLAALALIGAVSSGCTLGPDPQRPQTVIDQSDGFINAPDTEGDADALNRASLRDSGVTPWWQSFADRATAELVAEALDANTDLRGAAARVLEAQTRVKSARGARLPQISGDAGVTRSENSFILPQVGRVTVRATTYAASIDASYQLDLFGRLRRTQEAAWSDLLAEEAARETVVHSVIAGVVRSRAQLSTQGRAVDIARGLRDSWRGTLDTTESRYRAGLTTALDLRLARENLAAAEAGLVQAELALAQTGLALDVLLGRRPGSGSAPAELLEPLPDLSPVPLGLPADLLDRRPDLRQLEMRLAASTARIGAAIANLFPDLRLTGSAGGNSDTLSDLVSSEAFIYNAVANLLGPIFTGGQRRAEVTAAEARQQQAAAAYAGAVLTALREVEDALLRDRAVQERLTFTGTRLEEARAAHEIARERYRRGVLPLLQVLETERRLRQAEEAQVAAQGDAWNIRVDLMLALGGDWTAEPPPGAADPARAAATAETAEASVSSPAPEAPSTSPDSLNSIEEESR